MRSRIPLLAAFVVLALPVQAPAAPVHDGTFDLSTQPQRMALGPDGNVWVVLGNKLARVQPDGEVDDFPTSAANTNVVDITPGPSATGGANDRLWLSYNGGVIEFDPETQTGTEHAIAELDGPQDLEMGPDGHLWAVDSGVDAGLIEIDPNDGTLVQEVKVAGSSGRGITAGGDGRMWWVDFGNGLVRATNTSNGTATDAFDVGGSPQDIAAGPVDQLAFGNPGTDPQTVGRIGTDGVPETTPSPLADPFGVAFGSDGAYWFAQFAGNTLGRLTTDGQFTTPIDFPAGSGPRRIVRGLGNTLWVGLETSEKIARVSGVDPPPPPQNGGNGGPGGGGGDGGPGGTDGTNGTGVTPDTTDPRLGPLSIRPNAFRVGRDATIRFTLSENATILLRVQRVRKGRRRADGKCVKRRRGPRCTRYGRGRTFTRLGEAGPREIEFAGRIRGRRLKPGAYRLTVILRDAAGNESTPRRVLFRIKKRKRAGA